MEGRGHGRSGDADSLSEIAYFGEEFSKQMESGRISSTVKV
jgi:hypothetical protein